MNLKRYELVLIALLGFSISGVALAQEIEDDLEVIELEIERGAIPTRITPQEEQPRKKQEKALPVMELSDLTLLAPFKETSVIQKRFLPKTGRTQLFGGLGVITNDPFFTTVSAVGKASYFFNETWGTEFNYFANSTSERQATAELRDNLVTTESLIQTKSFLGIDAVWVPIYGKMTWFDDKIIPFDLYFSMGYGTTQTQAESVGTIHLATGQIFAITKGMAFRWDFSWNFFSARSIDNQVGNFNNLFLTVGMSFFFPEARYR